VCSRIAVPTVFNACGRLSSCSLCPLIAQNPWPLSSSVCLPVVARSNALFVNENWTHERIFADPKVYCTRSAAATNCVTFDQHIAGSMRANQARQLLGALPPPENTRVTCAITHTQPPMPQATITPISQAPPNPQPPLSHPPPNLHSPLPVLPALPLPQCPRNCLLLNFLDLSLGGEGRGGK